MILICTRLRLNDEKKSNEFLCEIMYILAMWVYCGTTKRLSATIAGGTGIVDEVFWACWG